MTKTPSAAHFVFVHGAFHGAWCWYKVKSLLESIGYKVTCVDLRCAGIDPSDPNTIFSFEEFNKPLDDLLSSLGEGDKVILVGHSAGGSNVTAALYKYPDKIWVAVYLVARMVKNNSVNEENDMMLRANESEIYEYVYGEGPNKPPTSLMIKKQFERQRFYQRSPIQDSTLAGLLLKPVPIRALQHDELPDGGKDLEVVPRVYIKTLDDNTFSQDAQDEMIEKWQPSDVYEIDSDHSAFFSAPLDLFGILHKVATKYAFTDKCLTQGIGASNRKIICGGCKARKELKTYQVSRSHDMNLITHCYANCIKCSSFFDVNAIEREAKGRQKMHEVVTIDHKVKRNKEKAYGSEETRDAFSRIYKGLKILMLLSVCILIALVLILVSKN